MACRETYVDFATANKNFFDCIIASKEFGLTHVFDIPESTIATPGTVGNSEVPTYTAFADLIYDIAKEQGTTAEISHVDAAFVAVWSAVHGLAVLLNNGYFDVYGDEKKAMIAFAVIANALRGISLDEVTEPHHSD
ncbi:WHG domain-containing protein [Corynebacterium incognita]|uniref:WHG domain-containing protein n=1 Tax=Corynebacterium incognita TaxID=2754725 RepID=A0A7G7CQC9_9CORY|nr:WHG domain-containing protein [Corynebacterium incognita]QNE89795.1 WHG domain-containing protein [Corynebacterium incognita]